MNPLRFLHTKDPEERIAMQAIARAGREIQKQHDLERANQIAVEISKIFKMK